MTQNGKARLNNHLKRRWAGAHPSAILMTGQESFYTAWTQSGPKTAGACFNNRLYSDTAMSEKLEIRESRRDESAAIESLYPEAFPDENLLPLVRELLNDAAVAISLVGTIDRQIVGHAIFTKCGVVGHNVKAALLGPLAVAPAWQRQGIGSAIVRVGLRWLEAADVNRVYVLGDPAYYGRLGFLPESLVEPPFPLPAKWDGAWQSQDLGETTTPCAGKLSVPPQWLQPTLWTP